MNRLQAAITAGGQALHDARPTPLLADLTTLRVGGPARTYVEASTEAELVDAVRAADRAGDRLLVLGGGSNLLVADDGFDGVVVRDLRQTMDVAPADRHGAVRVSLSAGHDWDTFTARAVGAGWVGVEALAGIPGTVGAAPVQNIGAYGQEVAGVVDRVRCWDRALSRVETLSADDLGFGYRTSLLKRSVRSVDGTESLWYPTPRYVVLDVVLTMPEGSASAPVAYAELARRLGVGVGDRASADAVREAVLELRAGKGMLVDGSDPGDDADHDRWSAGSFFTNPVVSSAVALSLPSDAPRFPAGAGLVKSSAAWLIEHAGFAKGFGLAGAGSAARLSTRHTLALTNRGAASAADVVALARTVRDGVRDTFGIELEPEPVLVGVRI